MGFDELAGGGKGAHLIGQLHGGHIEVKGQQTAVAILGFAGRFGGNLRVGQAGEGLHLADVGQAGGFFNHFLKFEEFNGLGDVVFCDGEVFGGEAFHVLTIFIFHYDGFND